MSCSLSSNYIDSPLLDSSSSQLNIYEFNSKFQPISDNDGILQVKLPGLALMHDFAITENYAVFVQPTLKVNGMQYMLSKEPGKTLTMDEEPSVRKYIAVLPIEFTT